jgi:nucleoid-associated protein YgaU
VRSVAGAPTSPVATAAPLPDLDRPAGAATHTHAEAAGTTAGVQSPRSFAVTPSSGTMPSAPTKPSAEPSTPTKPSTTIKRPTSEAPSSDASVSRSLRVSGDVVVRPGDTLWGIAARHLPPGACNAGIAREWPRWYQANRRVVGADPDLIRPGQHLRPPANSAEEQKR